MGNIASICTSSQNHYSDGSTQNQNEQPHATLNNPTTQHTVQNQNEQANRTQHSPVAHTTLQDQNEDIQTGDIDFEGANNFEDFAEKFSHQHTAQSFKSKYPTPQSPTASTSIIANMSQKASDITPPITPRNIDIKIDEKRQTQLQIQLMDKGFTNIKSIGASRFTATYPIPGSLHDLAKSDLLPGDALFNQDNINWHIKHQGMAGPVNLIMYVDQDKFDIVDGQHRLLAAIIAKQDKLQASITFETGRSTSIFSWAQAQIDNGQKRQLIK